MKWALTADLQFNTQPRYSVVLPDGTTSRLADTVEAFRWIVEEAVVTHGCQGLLVLGDIFDSRTSIDVSVLDKTCRAFADASADIEVHVLVGNHDSYLRTPSLNSLQALSGVAEIHEKVEEHGPFAFVPWTDDLDSYADSIKRAEKLDAQVMVSHAMFEGAVPLANKGIPLKLLRAKRWEAVFLGDVHEPICLREDPLIQYCGAPLQIHFGDAGGERGFWVYDDQTGAVEFVENGLSPRFHTLREPHEFDGLQIATDRDYFRVKPNNPDDRDAMVERARKESSWVEAEAAPDEFIKPRLDVHASMTDEDLLRRYCEHLGMGSELLVELGCEILEEARNV